MLGKAGRYAIIQPYADMAQLAEQRIRNAWVRGSSPRIGTIDSKGKPQGFPYLKKQGGSMQAEKLLTAMREYALEHDVPIMEDDALAFLSDFVVEKGIKTLLEVGTAIGYSSIALASNNPGLKILTLEIDEERAALAKENIRQVELNDFITVINCDARNYECEDSFDAILLDGPKAHNSQLLIRYEKCLKEDGYLIVDDVRFHGFIDNPDVVRTRRLRTLVRKFTEFKRQLLNNSEYECTELPIGDGLLIARRRKKYE